MFILEVLYHYGAAQKFLYGSDAEAASHDYEKIKTALAEYRQFKNDNLQTVEINEGEGGIATIRLEHLMSVALSDMMAGKQNQKDWVAYCGELDGHHERGKARSLGT